MEEVTTGSLIRRSFEVLRAGFVPFATLALIFYSPMVLAGILAPMLTDGGTGFAVGVGFLFALVLTPIASAAVVYGVFKTLRGEATTVGRCISVAASRWLPILILAVLSVLAIIAGYVMLIIPGVLLTYGLFVAAPALIVERIDPVDAMKRSWYLTDGYKLRLFFLTLFLSLIQLAISVPLNLAFGASAMGAGAPAGGLGLYQVLNHAITILFSAVNAIAAGVAYHDLRIVREGLDEDELISVFA